MSQLLVDSDYLDVNEAAIYARRHPGSIRRALRAGELHGSQTKPGGRYSIEPKCIRDYLAGSLCEHRQNVTQLGRAKKALAS